MSPITALVLALIMGSSVTADVDGYLERSAEAEFMGEQLISCDTPDGSRSSVFSLAQVEGAAVAWVAGAEDTVVRMAPGSNVTVAHGEVEAALIEGTLETDASVYNVGSTDEVEYLGRDAREVTLLREGEERVVLTVDAATDAIVRTVTLDGDGSRYCDRRLLSFTTDLSGVPSVDETIEGVPSQPVEVVPEDLPDEAAGFELVDTYELENGTLSYYSDGFFSAGVVLTSRPISFPEGVDVSQVEGERGRYRRSYQPGSVTLSWQSAGENVAVIGDLPPDLLDAFVAELPAPSTDGFFGRIWQRLFG